MRIHCVWEHNGNDSMIYASNLAGAFTRGENREVALSKMQDEIRAYLRWKNGEDAGDIEVSINQEWESKLDICDADTDVIFDEEKEPFSLQEYAELKELTLKSAEDFLQLYESIPDKNESAIPIIPQKITFLGPRPRTALEMYVHTKEVNRYYFGEIGVAADNEGTIYECRKRGFEFRCSFEN